MKNENKKSTGRLSGFYIALCCCVLMIGIAGYFTQKHTDTEDAQMVINNEYPTVASSDVFSDEITANTDSALQTAAPVIEITEPPAEDASKEEATAEIEAEPEPVADYAIDNPDMAGDAVTVSTEQPAFILPVSGEVMEPFSDRLIFNTALDDWRTHNGIDIAADKGCSVSAAAQGIVEAVYDNEMGRCVELSHPAGFVTRYMGLESVENLSEGKEVQAGDVIGAVGDCKGENVSAPHLHFEMEKNKTAVNPADYLPQE